MQTFEQLQQSDNELLREHAMIITGQLSGEQKALVLDTFKAGTCRLLISTVGRAAGNL